MQRSPIAAGIAAVAGSLATLACCLPLGFLGAAGAMSAAVFVGAARPYLMSASVALLAFGFVQVYRAPRCGLRRSRTAMALLSAATLIVLLVLLFPQIISGWLADWFPAG